MTARSVNLPFEIPGRSNGFGQWMALPKSCFSFTASLATAFLILPSLLLALTLRFGLGALVVHPAPWEGLVFLAHRLPDILAQAALEDLAFFGVLQQQILRHHPATTKLVPVAFAVTHVAVVGHVWGLPTWLAGGLLLSALTRRAAGSLWPAILVHGSANLGIECFRLLLALNLPAFQ